MSASFPYSNIFPKPTTNRPCFHTVVPRTFSSPRWRKTTTRRCRSGDSDLGRHRAFPGSMLETCGKRHAATTKKVIKWRWKWIWYHLFFSRIYSHHPFLGLTILTKHILESNRWEINSSWVDMSRKTCLIRKPIGAFGDFGDFVIQRLGASERLRSWSESGKS